MNADKIQETGDLNLKIGLKDYEINDLKQKLTESETKRALLEDQIQTLNKNHDETQNNLNTKYQVMEVQLKDHIGHIEITNKKDIELMAKTNHSEKQKLWKLIHEKENIIQNLELENKTIVEAHAEESAKLRQDIEILLKEKNIEAD